MLFVLRERSNSTPLVIAREASVETGRGRMKAFLGIQDGAAQMKSHLAAFLMAKQKDPLCIASQVKGSVNLRAFRRITVV